MAMENLLSSSVGVHVWGGQGEGLMGRSLPPPPSSGPDDTVTPVKVSEPQSTLPHLYLLTGAKRRTGCSPQASWERCPVVWRVGRVQQGPGKVEKATSPPAQGGE